MIYLITLKMNKIGVENLMENKKRKVLLTIDYLNGHYMERYLFITNADNKEIFRWCDHRKETSMYSLEEIATDDDIEMLIYYDTFMPEEIQKDSMENIELIGYDATIYYH